MYKCKIEKTHGPIGRDLRLLMNHTSTDETRPFLQGIFRDKNCLVSTDGRRLFITTQQDLLDVTAHLIGNIIGNIKGLSILEVPLDIKQHNNVIQGEIPKWSMIFRELDSYKHVVLFKVPTWVSKVHKVSEQSFIGIDFKTDRVLIGKDEKSDVVIHINIAYLAPYAGEQIFFHILDKAHGILITKDGNTSFMGEVIKGGGLKDKWLGVIMPMRF